MNTESWKRKRKFVLAMLSEPHIKVCLGCIWAFFLLKIQDSYLMEQLVVVMRK